MLIREERTSVCFVAHHEEMDIHEESISDRTGEQIADVLVHVVIKKDP